MKSGRRAVLLIALAGLVLCGQLLADTVFKADFTYTPAAPLPGQAVSFTDASQGLPTSWSWDFGDGATLNCSEASPTCRNPTHTYATADTYTVTLTISQSLGIIVNIDSTTKDLHVGAPGIAPVAQFTFLPAAPAPGQTVTFTDASTGTPTSWAWDFGDGSATSSLQSPTHVFAAAATYTVVLTVVNASGTSKLTKTVVVAAPGTAPTAQFSFLPAAPLTGQTVSFTNASAGSPTSWAWDFGDGATSTAQNPAHAFATANSYTVRLTAANAFGSNSTTRTVVVSARPPQAPQLDEFTVPTTVTADMGSIVKGSDGNLWATAAFAVFSAIVRISPADGSTTVFAFPGGCVDCTPDAIAAGSDGNLWFTEAGNSKIGRITTKGVITEFAVSGTPYGIAAGSDGNLWFTEFWGNKIGKITPAGTITEFPVPTSSAQPNRMAAGADGNLWFTEEAANKIGRITTAGVVTEFAVPTANAYPYAIAAGPDGNVWFTEPGPNKIGRITPTGIITEFSCCYALAIAAGPDGNLWFAGAGLGRISTAGVVTAFSVPTTRRLWGITAGPDGNLWVTAESSRSVGGIYRSTPVGVVTTFSAPRDTTLPSGITAGPDGALWFTEYNACQIGRVAPSGTVTESAAGCEPEAIVSGPDGNVWFTAPSGISRITTSGVLSQFFITGGTFEGIAAGPDGNLWFTDNGNYIGRITTAGVVTKFTIPTANAYPFAIVAGPDGNLWFTESSGNKVGRITTAGAITEFPIPTAFSYPMGIAAGPDGNLWFTERSFSKIGRITPAGAITEFAIPTARSYPVGIAAGPDGNLWFTEQAGNKIGRITPAGVISEFALSTPAVAPTGIARGSDGNMWFTEAAAGKIGRLDLASACVVTASTACLNAGRFRVRVAWQVPSQGSSGDGNAVSVTGDTGYFWFFSSNNIELMVKVLDGRAINGNFWVFYGALSNVQYTITVTDTQTGAIKTYQNPSGQLASVADTAAFGAASVTPPSASGVESDYARYAALTGLAQPGGEGMTGTPQLREAAGESAAASAACTPGAQALCLNSNRFRVQVNWQVPSQGTSGVGTAAVLTGDTGYFWFFSSNNVELVIKVLDGRAINGKFWVFYGALSNVQYTITVTDTTTNAVKTYVNASGNLASVADTAAF